ncbi:MAG TPA: hypothetical protein VL463_25065 [Kofleriaceae bacterium]|nr:hypothetical protein [Kofleriaceae bacterium]
MIKLSSPFEVAFARWCGAAPEVGPMKSPSSADDDFERAFREWEDVSFDALVDQTLADFDDDEEPTRVFARTPMRRRA